MKCVSKCITVMIVFFIFQLLPLHSFASNCSEPSKQLALQKCYNQSYENDILSTLARSTDLSIRANAYKYYGLYMDMHKMSVSQLHTLMEECLSESNLSPTKRMLRHKYGLDTNLFPNERAVSDAKLEWMIASTLLNLAGYKATSTLLDCSIYGTNYNEGPRADGLFTTKIRNTNTYKNWVSCYRRGQSVPSSISFEKSEDVDLYLSLHAVNIYVNQQASAVNHCLAIEITDVYDFAFMSDISFVSIVNNAAFYAQNIGALNNINVNIRLNE